MGCQKEVIDSKEYPRVSTLGVTNINSEGATFNGEVLSSGNTSIIEQGFLWDTTAVLRDNSKNKILLEDVNNTGRFKYRMSGSLNKNQKYYVKAFSKAQEYLVFGDVVSFLSKGSKPVQITSFNPSVGSWGDTISIKGQRLNGIDYTVYFGNLQAEILSSSDSIMKVIVPSKLNEKRVKILIESQDDTISSVEYFNYRSPEVSGISALNGTFNDELIITGRNLCGYDAYNVKVYFNETAATVIEVSSNMLKTTVPSGVTKNELQVCVMVDGSKDCYNELFQLAAPVIENVIDDHVFIGQTLGIEGQNFNPLPEQNVVLIDGKDAEVIEASANYLEIVIPDGIYINRDASVSMTLSTQRYVYDGTVYIADLWLKKGSIPDNGYNTSAVFNFSYGGFGYTAFNTESGKVLMYKYSPQLNEWQEEGYFPEDKRSKMVAFVIDQFAYVGGGNDNEVFWKYDILNKTWERISDFPKTGVSRMTSFAIYGIGYICTGEQTDNFWRYDPTSDQWEQLGDFIPEENWSARADLSFVIDNKGYIMTWNGNSGVDQLWQYNPLTNMWIKKANQKEYQFYSGRCVFALGQEAYLIPGAYDAICYKYSSIYNRWSAVKYLDGRQQAVCFTIDDVAYVGGGHNFSTSLSDFNEFKPLAE